MAYKVHTVDGKAGEVDLTYARKHSKMFAIPAAAAGTVFGWQTPQAIHIIGVRVYRAGGTAATAQVNNAALAVLATALASSTDAWASTTTVQNTAVPAATSVSIVIAGVTGSPTAITVQVDYTIDVV